MSQKPIHRIFILVSIAAFIGSAGFSATQLFSSAFEQPRQDATTAAAAKKSQLQAQEQGYELVLQREPENQMALQELVNVRLQMNDAKGAIAPLERLVQLNPRQQKYKMLLAQVKQRVGDSPAETLRERS
jgi:cytochrome c-type biogenesis protein CcmH/NrfG